MPGAIFSVTDTPSLKVKLSSFLSQKTDFGQIQ